MHQGTLAGQRPFPQFVFGHEEEVEAGLPHDVAGAIQALASTPRALPVAPWLRELMRDILDELFFHARFCKRKRLGRYCPKCNDDRQWIETGKPIGPLSFENCCTVLGLSDDRVRQVYMRKQ